MAWTLCDKQSVISITNAPESALDDFWSDATEALIRQYLGMPNLGLSVAVTNERHSGDNTNIVMVKRPPILSVTSVTIDDYILPASEYIATEYSIQLLYTRFTKGILNVVLAYQSGSDPNVEIDPLVKMTAAAMIAAFWNYKGRAGSDASIKWGSVEPEMGEENPNQKVGLTSHLSVIMKRMLRRERLRVR